MGEAPVVATGGMGGVPMTATSPLSPAQTALVDRLMPTLTLEQATWLGGYLAGWRAASAGAPEAQAPAGGTVVTVLYGSQTGNARALAECLSERLGQAGLAVTLHSLGDYEPRHLTKEQRLLVVISTQGDGDPPDHAVAFCEFLLSRKAPRLPDLRYAVLALGDSSYEHFCKTGRDIDERLLVLGATALHPRADCDLDFVETAETWMRDVLATLAAETGGQTQRAMVVTEPATATATSVSAYSRSNPFAAEVLENIDLNGRGADRSTRHLEISLQGSGLSWKPGDSLGVYGQNDPDLVEALLAAANWHPNTALDDGTPLCNALVERYEITVLTRPLLRRIAEITGAGQLSDLLRPEREADLLAYIAGRDLVDLVTDFSLRGGSARELVGALRTLPPRLYSIASAAEVYPDEAHITVRAIDYQAHGRARLGVCSTYVRARQLGESLPVFVQSNPNFGPPADGGVPLIMIGAGTGVAPFRAFVQQRAETGATGRNWLFFGERKFRTDFLYQTDWQRWMAKGVLTRMDVAFSRDGPQKVYVQNRMLERARELYAWLQDGACVYVCGDERHMAPDVHRALATILMRQGGLDAEGAEAYLAAMRKDRRYQRDVY